MDVGELEPNRMIIKVEFMTLELEKMKEDARFHKYKQAPTPAQ